MLGTTPRSCDVSLMILQRLATNELEELYVDLKIQDKLELEAKKKWSDGYDEDGEFAAYARAKLNGEPRVTLSKVRQLMLKLSI